MAKPFKLEMYPCVFDEYERAVAILGVEMAGERAEPEKKKRFHDLLIKRLYNAHPEQKIINGDIINTYTVEFDEAERDELLNGLVLYKERERRQNRDTAFDSLMVRLREQKPQKKKVGREFYGL